MNPLLCLLSMILLCWKRVYEYKRRLRIHRPLDRYTRQLCLLQSLTSLRAAPCFPMVNIGGRSSEEERAWDLRQGLCNGLWTHACLFRTMWEGHQGCEAGRRGGALGQPGPGRARAGAKERAGKGAQGGGSSSSGGVATEGGAPQRGECRRGY